MPISTKITRLILVAWLTGIAWVDTTQAALPSDENQIIATVPVDRPAQNTESDSQLIQQLIHHGKISGDQRYFGYAEDQLNRHADPNNKNWVLTKIYLLQQRHAFSDAQSLLEVLINANPNDKSLYFTNASLLSMLGRFQDAEENCLHAAGGLPAATYAACLTQASSNKINLQKRSATLEKLLAFDSQTHNWERAVLADAQIRLGANSKAEQNYRAVLIADPFDAASRIALADLYLQQQRWQDAQNLLENYSYLDSVLLRLALISRHLERRPNNWEAAVAERFNADAPTVSTDQLYYLLHWQPESKQIEKIAGAIFKLSKAPPDIALAYAAVYSSSDKNKSNSAEVEQNEMQQWLIQTDYYDARLQR